MTPEQLTHIAVQAGVIEHDGMGLFVCAGVASEVIAFGALVAAKEREACAQVAMEFRRGAGNPVCGEVAAAIRQRGAA